MSDHNTSSNSSARKYSTATSPIDTRTQLQRFEPITHDQDNDNSEEESTKKPDTIRRNRPPAISTSRVDVYGMFPLLRRGIVLNVY